MPTLQDHKNMFTLSLPCPKLMNWLEIIGLIYVSVSGQNVFWNAHQSYWHFSKFFFSKTQDRKHCSKCLLKCTSIVFRKSSFWFGYLFTPTHFPSQLWSFNFQVPQCIWWCHSPLTLQFFIEMFFCAAEILSDVSDFAVYIQIENQWGWWVNLAGWVWFCYTTTTEEFWVEQKRRERKQTNKHKRLG